MKNKQRKPIVDKNYLLEKFTGKGGWTYVEIPEVEPDKHAWFNWIKVCGYIDNYELKHSRLMPLGNGKLFLPVKTAIRKAIKKQEGDTVHIVLYPDNSVIEIPKELSDCFDFEDSRLKTAFEKEPEGRRKEFIEWIAEARKEETKAKRIARCIDYLKDKYNL
nr:YdeI/OmpD-associated family protein [uncultured Carboxylicivirga sp.]